MSLMTDIDVMIDGTVDMLGNIQVPYTSADLFSIDMLNPSVVTVTVSDPIVNDAVAAVGTFGITVVFDRAMNTGVEPAIDFPSDDPLLTGMTYVLGAWLDAFTYQADYSLTDADEELSNIAIRVDGGESENSNAQVAGLVAQVFVIDTKNPTVTSLTPAVTTVGVAQVGSPGFPASPSDLAKTWIRPQHR